MIYITHLFICEACGDPGRPEVSVYRVGERPMNPEGSLPDQWFIHDRRVYCYKHKVKTIVEPR